MPRRGRAAALALLGLVFAGPLLAQTPAGTVPAASLPGPLDKVGFDQRLGEAVPLDLPFRDENGRAVRLGDYFGKRPVVLALVYYDCPMLCTMVLNGLTSALGVLDFDAGRDFDVVAVSFDARETPELAAAKRATYLTRYSRAGTEGGWHFLTGETPAIERLAASVGFHYVYLPESDQFAHAAGVVALTPEGKIARYFYGVEYAPRDLRLGLVEAAAGRIGSVVDQILLYCYHYDPAIGRYSATAINLVRAGGVLTLAILGFFLIRSWRRERRQRAAEAASLRA